MLIFKKIKMKILNNCQIIVNKKKYRRFRIIKILKEAQERDTNQI